MTWRPCPTKLESAEINPEPNQTEPKLGHHHRKNHGCDAVLEMIQNMTPADQSESEPLLLIRGIEDLRAECDGSGRFCSLLIVHDGSVPCNKGAFEYCTFCTRSRRHLSMTCTRFRVPNR